MEGEESKPNCSGLDAESVLIKLSKTEQPLSQTKDYEDLFVSKEETFVMNTSSTQDTGNGLLRNGNGYKSRSIGVMSPPLANPYMNNDYHSPIRHSGH